MAPVRLRVSPESIDELEPPSAVVSLRLFEGTRDVRNAFCRDVNFFASEDAAAAWLTLKVRRGSLRTSLPPLQHVAMCAPIEIQRGAPSNRRDAAGGQQRRPKPWTAHRSPPGRRPASTVRNATRGPQDCRSARANRVRSPPVAGNVPRRRRCDASPRRKEHPRWSTVSSMGLVRMRSP